MKINMAKITNNQDHTFLGIMIDSSYFLDQDGHVWKTGQIKNYVFARKIPDNVKVAFTNLAKSHVAYIEATEQLKKQQQTIRQIEEEKRKRISDIRRAQGILNKIEFCKAFFDAIPEPLASFMDAYGYRVTFDPDGTYRNNSLYVARSVLIAKYMRNLSFTYTEYDGNIFIVDDPEKYPEYQKYIRENRKPLSVKSKLNEELCTGDKASLWYYGKYEIPIGMSRTLTAEYAKELAQKFCE